MITPEAHLLMDACSYDGLELLQALAIEAENQELVDEIECRLRVMGLPVAEAIANLYQVMEGLDK